MDTGGDDGTKALFFAHMPFRWNGATGLGSWDSTGIILHADTCEHLARSQVVSL